MLLYHGGDADRLDRILREGLRPRAKTLVKDNWKHSVSSNRQSVYLTTTYAFHFAGMFKRGLIIEVDRAKLDASLLFPDEDVLEQASRGLTSDEWPYVPPARVKTMVQRTRYYRKMAPTMPGYTGTSLDMMGTVGYYGAIPASAFRRVFVIDWDKVPHILRMQALDTMVSVLNYKVLADQHQALTRYFTLDPVLPHELSLGLKEGIAALDHEPYPVDVQAVLMGLKRAHATLAEAILDRSAITCVLGGEDCSTTKLLGSTETPLEHETSPSC